MNSTIIKYLLISALSFGTTYAIAQDFNANDAAKIQENARNAMQRGDYSNAILMFNQAIRLEPNEVSLRRDLAYTYYLSGDAAKGKSIIDEVINTDFADEQTFQIAAAIENKLGNSKKANAILNNGLKKFPQSALLYFNRGNQFLADQKEKNALENFQKGIASDPSFASNYLALAKLIEKTQPVWAIMYYETFINLEPFTKRTNEAKSGLLGAYKLYFQQNNTGLPSFGGKGKVAKKDDHPFVDMYDQLVNKSVTAITNGVSTETLTMLRTRIILEWKANYSINNPYTLFTYQDKLLSAGYFDAYNQWLFGAIDNSTTYATWKQSNLKLFTDFEKWINYHPLKPASYDPKPFN